MRKKVIHRCNDFVSNVNFNKLDEILKRKGLTKAEVSRKLGYYDEYFTKHVFREKKLTWQAANGLENVYGISPDEYICKEPEKNTREDEDLYQYTFSFNGEFLKKLALGAMKYHISIEDFIYKCLIEGIGDKIEEFEKTERKNWA